METKLNLPRGIRNRNPGNIKSSPNFIWHGQTGKDDDGFCIFGKAVMGIRAIMMLLQHYHTYRSCKTVRQYIQIWAPPTENDTAAYINDISSMLLVKPDEEIDLNECGIEFVRAIVIHENGDSPYSLMLYHKAAGLAHLH